MEILTGSREISVDDLEVLQAMEDTALFAAGEDPGKQDLVRKKFIERRTGITAPQQYGFTIAPLDFLNQMQALELAAEHGLKNADAKTENYLLGLLELLTRVTAWSGFEEDGQSLPCTLENKNLVFGQAFTVVQALQKKLMEVEAAEIKNSGTSAPG